MKSFNLKLSLDDDAAVTDFRATVAQALEQASQRVLDGRLSSPIRDVNGNRIGSFEVSR